MREPTEETGWIVVILLSVAATVANTLDDTTLGLIILMTLLAICAVLVLRRD